MDERQLVYAAAIEKAGSLRQAARELDREYSTLARSLKRLEEELGSPLFRRGSLGLRTTSEGEAFFAWARQALGVFRKMGRKQEGNLTEREMEYLLRIRREKGIARAAQSLYIAQPSLSQILMKLEEECGFALFTREKDGVRETNEGSRFLDQVEELAGIYRKMRRQLEEFQQPLGALAQGALAGPQAVDGRLDFGDVRLPGLIAGVQIGGSPSVLGVQLTAGRDFLFAHRKVLSFLPYSNHTTVGTMAQYSTAGAPGEALGEIFRTGKKGPAKLQQPFWDQYRITLVSPVLFNVY